MTRERGPTPPPPPNIAPGGEGGAPPLPPLPLLPLLGPKGGGGLPPWLPPTDELGGGLIRFSFCRLQHEMPTG